MADPKYAPPIAWTPSVGHPVTVRVDVTDDTGTAHGHAVYRGVIREVSDPETCTVELGSRMRGTGAVDLQGTTVVGAKRAKMGVVPPMFRPYFLPGANPPREREGWEKRRATALAARKAAKTK